MFKILKESLINLKPLRARVKEFAITPDEIKKMIGTKLVKQIFMAKFGNKKLLNVLIDARKKNLIEKKKENIASVTKKMISRILNGE